MPTPSRRPLSVGLFLTPWGNSSATDDVPRWSNIRDAALRAEAVGFDSVWAPDHLLIRFPGEPAVGVWEGWSLLSALAAVTDRVALGSLVTCAGFRNPALLAKMAVTVDEISGGRLLLGLGAGWHEPEFAAFGVPFDHRVDRFAEALAILAPLLRDGYANFAGAHHRADACELLPRGPRRTGPPIVVGAGGDRMLRLAARYADAWSRDFAPHDPAALAEQQERVNAACAAVGREPGSLARMAAIWVDLPGSAGPDDRGALSGSPGDIAAGLRAYANAGFSHLQLWLNPSGVAGAEAFAPVLERLDRG